MTRPVRILLLDTETNGLPAGRQIPVAQWQHYPAVLQLSWAIYEVDAGSRQIGLPVSKRDIGLALDPSVPWNAEAAAIHGISEVEARRGTPAAEALTELARILTGVDVVVAHNLAFDKAVLRAAGYAEADRRGSEAAAALRQLWSSTIQEFCTMKELRDLVAIPSPYYGAASGRFKAPKLNELYAWLYGHTYDVSGAVMHTARADTHCLAQCLSMLLRRGIVSVRGRCLVTTATAATTHR